MSLTSSTSGFGLVASSMTFDPGLKIVDRYELEDNIESPLFFRLLIRPSQDNDRFSLLVVLPVDEGCGSSARFLWNASDQNVAARLIVIGSVVNTVSKCAVESPPVLACVQLTSQDL